MFRNRLHRRVGALDTGFQAAVQADGKAFGEGVDLVVHGGDARHLFGDVAQDGVGTDGIDGEDSEQDPQCDVHYAGWGQMEEGKAEGVAEFQGKDAKDSPEHRILEADVAVHVPFFIGIIPPFAVADALQDVAGDPFGGCCDDHTAEEQEYRAGLQLVQVACHSNGCDSVDGTQWAV